MRNILLMLTSIMFGSVAHAADISFVSGLYEKKSTKIDGKNAGSSTTMSLGGRFHQDLDTTLAWFAQTQIDLNTYTSSNNAPAPDNSANLAAGGGVRYYFKPFAPAVVPYAAGLVEFKNNKTADWTTQTSYTEKTSTGIFYGGDIGIRAGLGANFFAELELPLFKSALFAVNKSKTVTETNNARTTSETEDTYNEAYIDTVSPILSATLAVGMKL